MCVKLFYYFFFFLHYIMLFIAFVQNETYLDMNIKEKFVHDTIVS